MKKVFFIFFIILPIFTNAQMITKFQFVSCPEINIQKQFYDEGQINIVCKDSRIYEKKKTTEKCSHAEFMQYFSNYIQESFPKLKINFLNENQFDEKSLQNIITFKIDIKKCDAMLTGYNWDSNSKFLVDVFDNRKDTKTYQFECNSKGNSFNTWGGKNAKIAINISFNLSFVKLISLVEDGLKENSIDSISVQPSKANELRELKKLLDEKVLTQEEFEIEKKKILK